MSNSNYFARFRANTLKSMLKWIEDPHKTHIASTLQKYIPMDRDKDIRNKKLTNAVKLQLIEIDKLSANHRDLLRQIVKNVTNLTDNVFIQSVKNAKKGGTSSTFNTTHCNNTNGGTHETIATLMQCTAPLHQSIKETDHILTALTQRMTTNTQKLAMLNELAATMTVPIEGKEIIMNELKKNKTQEAGWKFRKQIVNDVIHKIKKKEHKLLQNKKQLSLQQLMERMTLSKNKSLCQLTLNLNTINMECDSIKKQLMKLCTDIHANNMDKMYVLQTQKKQKEKEKELISQKISRINIVIQGIGLLLNEIINQLPIDIESWYNLSTSNKGNIVHQTPSILPAAPALPLAMKKEPRSVHSNINKTHSNNNSYKYNGYNNAASSNTLNLPPITPFANDKPLNAMRCVQSINRFPSALLANNERKETKRKFKRPTRSNVVKAKRLNICDVLPQKLCTMQLSNDFLENGLVRDTSKSMFCGENKERNEWIDTYNKRHLPALQKKYRSLYGQNICFKPMEKYRMNSHEMKIKTYTNTHKHCNQATVRKTEEIKTINNNVIESVIEDNMTVNTVMNVSGMSVDGEKSSDDDDEFINVSDDDMTHSQHTSAEPQILHAPSPNIERQEHKPQYTKNGKQSLNIRTKANMFRAQNTNRNDMKSQHKNGVRGKKQRQIMDRNHPLLVNDPLNRIQNEHIENETFGDGLCLHYVARGMCKFRDNGCAYKHPPKYDAKRFYCIQLATKGNCTRSDCKYGHNLNEVPCRDYYAGQCQQSNCLRNHALSEEEFNEWVNAYESRQMAYRKWRNINTKRYEKRQVAGYKYNGDMNHSVVNDDRLHNVAHHSLFDSALTE